MLNLNTFKTLLFLLSLMILFTKPEISSAQKKLYITNQTNNEIIRSDLDGSNPEKLISKPALNPDFGLTLDAQAQKLYWTDASSKRIQRMDVDGSNAEILIQDGLEKPQGIALDLTAGKIYWIDQGTQKIQRANLDGSEVEDLISEGLGQPGGIAIDPQSRKMYWTDQGTQKIQRANLDGSEVEDIFDSEDGVLSPLGIALDPERGRLYWVDTQSKQIYRANLDGTEQELLLNINIGKTNILSDIVLDLKERKMYWTLSGITADGKDLLNEIQRANMNGTDPRRFSRTKLEPFALALDTEAGVVYWTINESFSLGKANVRNPKAERFKIQDSQINPRNIVIDEINGKMYWANVRGGTIQRANLDGSEREVLIDGIRINGIALDIANNHLYWIEGSGGQIRRSNLNGENIAILLSGLDEPLGLRLDLEEGKIYWAQLELSPGNSGRRGFLRRANLDGSEMENLVTLFRSSSDIALDQKARKMYWLNGSEIRRANLDGSQREVVLDEPTLIFIREILIDEDEDKIYWVGVASNNVVYIQRANLDGSNIENLVVTPPKQATVGLAIGPTRANNTILDLALADAQSNQVVGNLVDGAVIDLANFADKFDILASDPAEVKSVRFRILDAQGKFVQAKLENFAPYVLGGNVGDSYNGIELVPGEYSLEAIPYAKKNGVNQLSLTKISFTVINSATEDVSLRVFPNSTSGPLSLKGKLGAAQGGVFQLYNAQGKMVIQKSFNQELDTQLNLENLPEGIYLGRLIVKGNQVINQRIVVKR